MESVPFTGEPEGREMQEVMAQFDAPAYIRRARGVEHALDDLLAKCRRQREEWLPMVKLRLGQLHALAGDWPALRPFVADEEQLVVLESLHRTLSPKLRLPLPATTSERVLRSRPARADQQRGAVQRTLAGISAEGGFQPRQPGARGVQQALRAGEVVRTAQRRAGAERFQADDDDDPGRADRLSAASAGAASGRVKAVGRVRVGRFEKPDGLEIRPTRSIPNGERDGWTSCTIRAGSHPIGWFVFSRRPTCPAPASRPRLRW